MLRFVRTLPKDAAAQMVERWLSQQFSNEEGVCYYKHPVVMINTGVIPDFVLFTKTNQPLVIKIIDRHLQDIGFVEKEWQYVKDCVKCQSLVALSMSVAS